jgi:hypothetical protein
VVLHNDAYNRALNHVPDGVSLDWNKGSIMQAVWSNITIGSAPVPLSADFQRVCKIFVQSAPGNQGNLKIGAVETCTTSDATTPGSFLSPSTAVNPDGSRQAGDSWTVESHDTLTLFPTKYVVHGTTPGDIALVCFHVA